MFSGDTVSSPIDILRAFNFSPYVKSSVSVVSSATAALILPEFQQSGVVNDGKQYSKMKKVKGSQVR
jgi:hypothetical protein